MTFGSLEPPRSPLVETEEQLSKLAENAFYGVFERLTAIECSKGDTLLFKFGRKMQPEVMQRIATRFDGVLKARGLSGLFMSPDVDFVGVLSPKEKKDGTESDSKA